MNVTRMSLIELTPDQVAAYEAAREAEEDKDLSRETESLVHTLAKLAANKTTRHGGGGQGISGQKGLMRWIYDRSSKSMALPSSRPSEDEPLPGFRIEAQSIDIVKRRSLRKEQTLASTILNVTIERGIVDDQIGWTGLVSPIPIVKATSYPPSIQIETWNGALEEAEPNSPAWMQLVELVDALDTGLPAAE